MKQSIEAAIQKIQSAFLPFRCVAEEDDYGARIKFAVFVGEERYENCVSKDQFSDAVRLEGLLESAKREAIKLKHGG